MSFNDIVGNEKVKNDLEKMIETNNILHSYMFVGQDGIGKKLFAKEFAKKVLCINKEYADCSSCVKFDSNNHPDFFILNEEGETIKVEQIRDLTSKINEKPIVSNKKIYIINDSEKMTVDAANCLLKTLEEPPEYAVIILIVANESMILNTVKSRCIKIKFSNLKDDVLRKYLEEHYDVKDIGNSMIRLFNGSIGSAIKLLDKKEIYSKVDVLVESFSNDSIIEILSNSKFMHDKENITLILNYLIVCFYEYSSKNYKFLNCIDLISEAIKRLNANSNFDMTIDSLLLNIWEEVN